MELKVNTRYLGVYDAIANDVTFFEPGKLSLETLSIPHLSVYDVVVGGGAGSVEVCYATNEVRVCFDSATKVTPTQAVILVHEMIGLMETAKEG